MLCVDWRFAFLKLPYCSLYFGRPFLTPYQIAIKFQELYPQDFQTIGKPIGGNGTGQQDSLAQYIALNLSQRIKSEAITNIEERFLHRANLHSLKYEVNNQLIGTSSKHAYDLLM